ncbi:MAG: hypothetical protein NW241_15710 [Bacteroidia bacterium]|nr:hypothetical protein [Bacteroidia bacterium]
MKHALRIVVFLLASLGHQARGQSIEQLTAERTGDSVRIRYELRDSVPGRSYQVSLYGVIGRDTVLLKAVSGDVGGPVRPGRREITWNAIRELGRYRGSLRFVLRAVPVFVVYPFRGPASHKQGQPVTAEWYGGNSIRDPLLIELYQYDQRLDTLDRVKGVYQYTWKIPGDLPPGEGYRLRVSSLAHPEVAGFTQPFSVTRRFSTRGIALASGAVSAGAVAAIILARILPRPPDPE